MSEQKKMEQSLFWETVNTTFRLIAISAAMFAVVGWTLAGTVDAKISGQATCLIAGICAIKYLKQSLTKMDIWKNA
jgi:hypothetical protein